MCLFTSLCFSLFFSVILPLLFLFFFFNDPAPTEIYTLSLHDALPICALGPGRRAEALGRRVRREHGARADRKSTRLNSSHRCISYAVFCLKKKKKKKKEKRKKGKKKEEEAKKKVK